MSWETTRGLVTDYIGTVTDARFKFHPQYQNGTRLLAEWDLATDNPEIPTTTERFSCGDGWTTTDGANAHRTDGGDKFQKSSIYGHVIETVKADQGAIAHLQAAGDPTQASVWVGTKWRFEKVELVFGKNAQGEEIKSTRVMPVEFLGAGEGSGAQGVGPGAQPVPQAAQGAPNPQANGSAPLYDSLRPIAQAAPDHATFVREALAVDGVQPIIDQVADDSDNGLYSKLKSGAV